MVIFQTSITSCWTQTNNRHNVNLESCSDALNDQVVVLLGKSICISCVSLFPQCPVNKQTLCIVGLGQVRQINGPKRLFNLCRVLNFCLFICYLFLFIFYLLPLSVYGVSSHPRIWCTIPPQDLYLYR